jgi:hypothetical protein
MWPYGSALVEFFEVVNVALYAMWVSAREFLVALGLEVGLLLADLLLLLGLFGFLDGVVVLLLGHFDGSRVCGVVVVVVVSVAWKLRNWGLT